MTVFGRDASHYDADKLDFAGLTFFTHKASEGTTNPDAKYGAHMAAAKAAGVPVLGSYHVLRTPGSGGAGSLAQQLAYWVARQDALTPWWRAHPHWVMQIDAEKWPYDSVSADNVKAFASLLARSGLPGWKVTYASRGQYGDSLKGIATPLWNAAYGSNTGTYPGDSGSGWTAYSGQTPVLWQYGSNPYDRNAFRGSREQLLALVGGDDMAALTDEEHDWLKNLYAAVFTGGTDMGPAVPAGERQPASTTGNSLTDVLQHTRKTVEGLGTAPAVDLDALAGKVADRLIASNANGLSDADHAAIVADVKAALRAGTGS